MNSTTSIHFHTAQIATGDQGHHDAAEHFEYMDADRWDELASQFDDAVHEQSHCYNAARWGEKNVENISMFANGQAIGGASVILLKAPIIKTGIAIVKWGPLWRKRGAAPDPKVAGQILSQLQAEYAARRGFHLTIMPPADPHHCKTVADHLNRLGFVAGTTLPAPERYLIDVTLSEPELRKTLSQKWRYNLKKSERNEFDIKICDNSEGFDEFIGLYESMLGRKQFNDTSAINTLKELMESKTEAFRPRIFLLSFEGKLAAGVVIDLSGNRAVYLYGATNDRALSLNAGYAIHWYVASFLRERSGVLSYDLGGNDRDKGLHQFKKGFVGRNGHLVDQPPSYHYGATVKSRTVGKTVFLLRDLKRAVSRKLGR